MLGQVGMTTSNEPGYYEDGEFGIRVEKWEPSSHFAVKAVNDGFEAHVCLVLVFIRALSPLFLSVILLLLLIFVYLFH